MRTVAAVFPLLLVLVALFSTACGEEEVVDCFYIGLDRYCVKVAESTKCVLDISSDRVKCTDKDGNEFYPDKFEFDDGNLWLPE